MVYYIFVVAGVLLASISQILLKKSAATGHGSLFKEYLNLRVIGGYSLLALSLFFDLWAMRNGVLAKEVSSIEALSYLFVPLLGCLILKEKISGRKIVAIILIMTGVIVFFL